MSANSTFQPFISWLTTLATAAAHAPLEAMLDTITGTPDTPLVTSYESPIFSYYFGDATQPERYFTYLESLRTIRAKLREYQPNQPLYLDDFCITSTFTSRPVLVSPVRASLLVSKLAR